MEPGPTLLKTVKIDKSNYKVTMSYLMQLHPITNYLNGLTILSLSLSLCMYVYVYVYVYVSAAAAGLKPSSSSTTLLP